MLVIVPVRPLPEGFEPVESVVLLVPLAQVIGTRAVGLYEGVNLRGLPITSLSHGFYGYSRGFSPCF